MTIAGHCHCGNVSFTLAWEPEPREIVARVCSCSFCTRHGAAWTSCPTGTLRIAVADRARLSEYGFATRTARFLVCASCGAVPVVTSHIDGREYGVVNVNSFDGVDPALVRRVAVEHGDEDVAVRLARRARAWTPIIVD